MEGLAGHWVRDRIVESACEGVTVLSDRDKVATLVIVAVVQAVTVTVIRLLGTVRLHTRERLAECVIRIPRDSPRACNSWGGRTG